MKLKLVSVNHRTLFRRIPTPPKLNENTPHSHMPLDHNLSVHICITSFACQSGTGKDIMLQRVVLWPIDHLGVRESHWTNKGRAGGRAFVASQACNPYPPPHLRLIQPFHLRLLITDMPPSQTERQTARVMTLLHNWQQHISIKWPKCSLKMWCYTSDGPCKIVEYQW